MPEARTPRTPTVAQALRRHFVGFAVITVLALGSGIGTALWLPVKYGAEARVIVGQGDSDTGAASSSGSAGESMAVTYSRMFDGDQVQDALHEALGGRMPLAISASVVPGSSVILVEAQDLSPDAAVEAADAGTKALMAVVGSTTDADKTAQVWLERYAEAAKRLSQAEAALDAAQRALAKATRESDRSAATAALVQARADQSTAQVEVSTYAAQYGRVMGSSSISRAVQPLRGATFTSSTRLRNLELFGALGGMVGVALGLAFAYGRYLGREGLRVHASHAASPEVPESEWLLDDTVAATRPAATPPALSSPALSSPAASSVLPDRARTSGEPPARPATGLSGDLRNGVGPGGTVADRSGSTGGAQGTGGACARSGGPGAAPGAPAAPAPRTPDRPDGTPDRPDGTPDRISDGTPDRISDGTPDRPQDRPQDGVPTRPLPIGPAQ